ncbi:hypothetical protein PF008_g19603 [Phytophthora fragariae]|uniref:DUF7869 domain-containing protein n=1 Tax=Phytophthora fragariae TaxID=53985 RepID=A0A6G0R264_9STRA|nr:hypothetical protein PF008_g19603 [Phytophthora fragariae]
MDFSQNLTVPSVSPTPSQWYFCSLVAVNVFAIFYENERIQTNYVYDETVSGKGSDQINSMLHHFIRTVLLPSGKTKLVVYADNCGGQNKNNLVIKFLLAQVHMGVLNRIDYKFFVKGHTKNSCDRSFGHIRKFVSRQDCWTLGQVVSAVRDSATSNRTVHISCDDGFFKGYKSLVKELYKNLTGVQQYQWFEMDASQPGMVDCRKSPSADAEEQYLRRKVDGILTENTKVARMFEHFLESLSVPGVNTEKKYTMHYVVRPYVPEEFRGDEIYAALSKEQDDSAKAAKQSRHQHPAAMALTAKENLDQRGRGVQEEEEEATVAKKKPRKFVRVFCSVSQCMRH